VSGNLECCRPGGLQLFRLINKLSRAVYSLALFTHRANFSYLLCWKQATCFKFVAALYSTSTSFTTHSLRIALSQPNGASVSFIRSLQLNLQISFFLISLLVSTTETWISYSVIRASSKPFTLKPFCRNEWNVLFRLVFSVFPVNLLPPSEAVRKQKKIF